MPAVADFRADPGFDRGRIERSGRDLGRNVYWQLYVVENLLRVLVHSVLRSQVGEDWWSFAVDERMQRKARRHQESYARRPWHGSPGAHGLYFVDLADLSAIIRANRRLFSRTLPDVDEWVVRIEQVRLPRNVVAHMNWPSVTDRKRIDVLHSDVRALAIQLTEAVPLVIP